MKAEPAKGMKEGPVKQKENKEYGFQKSVFQEEEGLNTTVSYGA